MVSSRASPTWDSDSGFRVDFVFRVEVIFYRAQRQWQRLSHDVAVNIGILT